MVKIRKTRTPKDYKRLLFVKQPIMMNLQKVKVKFKYSIYTELCLKPWFESAWYFCNIIFQDGFESDCPEKELQAIIF